MPIDLKIKHETGCNMHLLNVQLIRMCRSVLLELLPISWQDVEHGDDVKEAASRASGSGDVGVQLVLAP